ncbi:MAG TPA: TauD/TfdA family dioxygenase [Pseudonocardiaceae bacterium]|jgi:hypothetical protein
MTASNPVLRQVNLDAADVAVLDRQLGELAGSGLDVRIADDAQLTPLARISRPDRLAEALAGPAAPALLVTRPPIDEPIGPTPGNWRANPGSTPAHDLWLALLAETVGTAVCWSSLQAGRLVLDVLPVRGHEQAQTGAGSRAELEFHVEDAFDADRCDVLLLLGLRNAELVGATVGVAPLHELGDADLDVLSAPRYLIRPDPEHRDDRGPAAGPDNPVPVLCWQDDQPLLRIDPSYTTPLDGTAAAVFRRLCAAIADRLTDVVLRPGDVLVVDNQRAVHGRRSFRPSYDGTDRWLRKMTAVRDVERVRHRMAGGGRRLVTWQPHGS